MLEREKRFLEAQKQEREAKASLSSFTDSSFLSQLKEEEEDLPSLPSLFLTTTKDELKRIKKTLSYIISILHNPHLSHKEEIAIVKSQMVSSYDDDLLEATREDSSLWSMKGRSNPLPKEIYTRLSDDDLCIYENFFLTAFIDILNEEVSQRELLSSHLLKSLKEEGFLSSNEEESSLLYLGLVSLRKKIERIKDTPFYKVVKKRRPDIARYEATNILIHDPLYHFVYKDYLERIKPVEEKEVNQLIEELTLPSFFYALYQQGYRYKEEESSLKDNRLVFEKDKEAKLTLEKKEDNQIKVTIESLLLQEGDKEETYLLSFREGEKKQEARKEIEILITPFSIKRGKEEHFYSSTLSLCESLLSSFYYLKQGEEEIYLHVCPNCLSSHLEREGNKVICSSCHTTYSFLKKEDGSSTLWIRNQE